MAATYELKSTTHDGRYLVLKCTQVRNVAKNTSTINWTLTSTGGSVNYYSVGPTTAKINGKTVYSSDRVFYDEQRFPAARGSVSGSTEVQHNSDGSCSIPISIATAIYYYNVTTTSGTWTLEKNPRGATLLTAPHFTDEENPVITYSNPAGDNVDYIEACISNVAGDVLYADYRPIDKVGSSYTFELTDAERNALRWASINSPNLAVKFYVTTTIDDIVYYSVLDKIVTIANANPIIDPVVKDTGGYSTPLTGDANKIIKGFNYMNVVSNAVGVKGATIKSQSIRCGEHVISGGSGGFDNVETNVFEFTATDSRGYTTTKIVTKELIEYIKLTCNLSATNPTTDGEATLKISGNYFNGSFGAVSNTLSVAYRFKENNGAWGEWINVDAPRTNDTYDATINVTGLNYRSAYTFQAKAVDKVAPIESQEKRVKAIPVFDWGEEDFQFNVDVLDKNGGQLGTNMTANDYDAVMSSGKALLESGWVTITPKANEPTAAYITFKRHYKKIPVVLVTASSGVIGTQLLGAATNGMTNDGANIVITRTNTTPTSIYYYVFGEVE